MEALRECHLKIGVTLSQVKGCQKLAANCQKLGESHGTDFPSHPSKGTDSAETWISDF